MRNNSRTLKLLIIICLIATTGILLAYINRQYLPAALKGSKTTESVISEIGEDADRRLAQAFADAGIEYPPKAVKLLALKEEKTVELWAGDTHSLRKVRDYPVLAASGTAGPKLREGDKQVPEGFYRTIALNPNSSYHLSIKLNYPNEFDLMHASAEGRNEPGSLIFIHGKAVSIGCLAMGDEAIEEIFTLVYRSGLENTEVVIAPWDPRKKQLTTAPDSPTWLPGLYQRISEEFAIHPYPTQSQ